MESNTETEVEKLRKEVGHLRNQLELKEKDLRIIKRENSDLRSSAKVKQYDCTVIVRLSDGCCIVR